MTINNLLELLKQKQIVFQDVLSFIEGNYEYTAASFQNGEVRNASNENQGSARVFALAQLAELSLEDTLRLFAEHYEAVKNNPNGVDHQNIRQFIKHGWAGISFDQPVLKAKA